MPAEFMACAVTVRPDRGAQLFRLGDQLLSRHFFNVFVRGASGAILDRPHQCRLSAGFSYCLRLADLPVMAKRIDNTTDDPTILFTHRPNFLCSSQNCSLETAAGASTVMTILAELSPRVSALKFE